MGHGLAMQKQSMNLYEKDDDRYDRYDRYDR